MSNQLGREEPLYALVVKRDSELGKRGSIVQAPNRTVMAPTELDEEDCLLAVGFLSTMQKLMEKAPYREGFDYVVRRCVVKLKPDDWSPEDDAKPPKPAVLPSRVTLKVMGEKGDVVTRYVDNVRLIEGWQGLTMFRQTNDEVEAFATQRIVHLVSEPMQAARGLGVPHLTTQEHDVLRKVALKVKMTRTTTTLDHMLKLQRRGFIFTNTRVGNRNDSLEWELTEHGKQVLEAHEPKPDEFTA